MNSERQLLASVYYQPNLLFYNVGSVLKFDVISGNELERLSFELSFGCVEGVFASDWPDLWDTFNEIIKVCCLDLSLTVNQSKQQCFKRNQIDSS